MVEVRQEQFADAVRDVDTQAWIRGEEGFEFAQVAQELISPAFALLFEPFVGGLDIDLGRE